MEQIKDNIKKVVLKKEIVSYYQHLFTLIPKAMHLILQSGRAATKSTFISMWNLFRLLYYPNADIMVIAYEYESIVKKAFMDYKFAAKVLKIPKQQIEFYSTKNGETWIKVRNKYGSVNKIWFEHGKGGSESFKGYRPSDGNKWLDIRFYELTNFINWNPTELLNTIATFIRDAYSNVIPEKVIDYCTQHNIELPDYWKDDDYEWVKDQDWFLKHWDDFMSHEFCIEYEFNNTTGTWVDEWLAIKKQQKNVYYQFNNYLDMTEREKYKFLKGSTLDEIENMKLVDPINYGYIFLGQAAYDGDVTFPTLSPSIHLGKHENFKPDILVIGVDIGLNDATVCTLNGFEYRHKDLRIALGMHVWSHSNRRARHIKDDVIQPYRNWDENNYANMILEFCDMCHNEFPYARIYFQMDREGAGNIFYNACFRYKNPNFLDINRLWKKENTTVRIGAMNLAFNVPGIVKFYNRTLFEAYRNQKFDPHKRDKETGERMRLDDPSNPLMNMDYQDSCEYGVLPWFWEIIKDRIMKDRGKYVGLIEQMNRI